jgi:hypothetical protein
MRIAICYDPKHGMVPGLGSLAACSYLGRRVTQALIISDARPLVQPPRNQQSCAQAGSFNLTGREFTQRHEHPSIWLPNPHRGSDRPPAEALKIQGSLNAGPGSRINDSAP